MDELTIVTVDIDGAQRERAERIENETRAGFLATAARVPLVLWGWHPAHALKGDRPLSSPGLRDATAAPLGWRDRLPAPGNSRSQCTSFRGDAGTCLRVALVRVHADIITWSGAAGACCEQIARDALNNAITASPATRRVYPVALIDGTWVGLPR